ncbi:hypothetical protein [Geobacter sp.]|uniref:hypothetical protein n=1 Tax=Geobacter sp. TaxID=46610 RepID=UPI0027BB0938|nr:hypothetical protein [Geobacter sp.]
MKVLYEIPVRSGVTVPVNGDTPPLRLGNALINWKISTGGNLESVIIEFSGVQMQYTETGSISSSFPSLEQEAYTISYYIANRLLIQTAFDAIRPSRVLSDAPTLIAETLEEKEELSSKGRSVWSNLDLRLTIRNEFAPSCYTDRYEHSAAYGYFAEAHRAASEFQQFELLYKVVEYFFSEDGTSLDAAVSAHIVPHDSSFTSTSIESLRRLRSRIVHPRARHGHIDPQFIVNVQEVRKNLPLIKQLAALLLEHPTF